MAMNDDSQDYFALSLNLLNNGCYSLSDFRSGACVPSWGSQPPGYPLFLVAVQLLVGPLYLDFVLAQICLFAVAATAAIRAAYAWHRNTVALIASIVWMAASPTSLGWSGWLLTETLAAAAGLWVFTELAWSLLEGRMRIWRLALALTTAVLMRWDQIALIVPIAVCCWYLRGSLAAIRQTVMFSAAACVPLMAMIARAAAVGLPLLPSVVANPGVPAGAATYWRSHALSQMALPQLLWPAISGRYALAGQYVDPSAFRPGHIGKEADRLALRAALDAIAQLPDGTPFPAVLDDRFRVLSAEHGGNRQFDWRLLTDRAVLLWGQRDGLLFSGWVNTLHKVPAETCAQAFRLGIMAMFLIALAWVGGPFAALLGGIGGYVAARTVLLVSLTALETRYLMPMMPMMEIATIAALGIIAQRTRQQSPAASRGGR